MGEPYRKPPHVTNRNQDVTDLQDSLVDYAVRIIKLSEALPETKARILNATDLSMKIGS